MMTLVKMICNVSLVAAILVRVEKICAMNVLQELIRIILNHTKQNSQEIVIKKNTKNLKIAHPIDYNYFKILNKKLKWGGRS